MNEFKNSLKVKASQHKLTPQDIVEEELKKEFEEKETQKYNFIYNNPDVQEYISNVMAAIMISHYQTYGQHTSVNMPHRIKALESAKSKIKARLDEAECVYSADGKNVVLKLEPISDYIAGKMILRNPPHTFYSKDGALKEKIEKCKRNERFLESMQEFKGHLLNDEFVRKDSYTYDYTCSKKEYYEKCREILEHLIDLTNPKATGVLDEYQKKISLIDQKIGALDTSALFAQASGQPEETPKTIDKNDLKNPDLNFLSLLEEFESCLYDERDLSILTRQFKSLFKNNDLLESLGVSLNKKDVKEKRTKNGFTSNFVFVDTLVGTIEIQLQTEHQYREGNTGRAAHCSMDGKGYKPLAIPDPSNKKDTQEFVKTVDRICPEFFHAKMDDTESNRVIIQKFDDYQRYKSLLSEIPSEVLEDPKVQQYWDTLYERKSEIFDSKDTNSQTFSFIPYDIKRYVQSSKFDILKDNIKKLHIFDIPSDPIVLSASVKEENDKKGDNLER